MNDYDNTKFDIGPGLICRVSDRFAELFENEEDELSGNAFAEAELVLHQPDLQQGPLVSIYAVFDPVTGDLLDVLAELSTRAGSIENLFGNIERRIEHVGFAFIPDDEIEIFYGTDFDDRDEVVEDICAEINSMFSLAKYRGNPVAGQRFQ